MSFLWRIIKNNIIIQINLKYDIIDGQTKILEIILVCIVEFINELIIRVLQFN